MIPGIYNYCDRWCEKCQHTHQCSTYAGLKAEGLLDIEHDAEIKDAEFWENLSKVFEQTIELLYQAAAESGIDIEDVNLSAKQVQEKIEQADKHPLCSLALDYSKKVTEFFENTSHIIDKEVNAKKNAEQRFKISDAIEIISFYQTFIGAKISRTITAAITYDQEKDSIEINDALGSAKIALIAIDRSMSAFTLFFNEVPAILDDIISLLYMLEKMKKGLEAQFPNAYEFIRPGLDE